MSRDGSGNYGLPAGNPVTTNTVISSTWANLTLADIGAALTQSLSKDGQTTPTANLTMGNFRLISLAAGTNRTDAINVGQVQDNTPAVLSSIAGTGDAITAATAPAILTYATDSKFVYTPATTNTLANPTIAIDGLAAKTITQSNGSGLWGGALAVGTPYELLYDGTNFRVQTGQLGASIGSGSPYALRNRIIDGGFQLWDSGTSFNITAGNTQYTADMWVATPANGAATVSQGIFPVGGEPAGVTTPCGVYLSFNQTGITTGGQNPILSHRIESVGTLEARTATFSLWLWAAAPVTITTINFAQSFGSGGSTAVTTPATVNWNLTTTPQRFSVSIAIPSISGKTVGAGSYLAVALNFPSAATFTVNTTQWQLEESPAGTPTTGLPTPFESRPVALEQSLVSRFLQVLNFNSGSPFAPIIVTSATSAFSEIVVSGFRATPAVTVGGAGSLRAFGNLTWSSTTVGMPSINTLNIAHTITVGTAWQTGYSFFNGGNGTITLDARL